MRKSTAFLATSSREPAGKVKFPAGQQLLSAAVDWATPLGGNKNRLSATPRHRDRHLAGSFMHLDDLCADSPHHCGHD
jgi:hypothetical protein